MMTAEKTRILATGCEFVFAGCLNPPAWHHSANEITYRARSITIHTRNGGILATTLTAIKKAPHQAKASTPKIWTIRERLSSTKADRVNAAIAGYDIK